MHKSAILNRYDIHMRQAIYEAQARCDRCKFHVDLEASKNYVECCCPERCRFLKKAAVPMRRDNKCSHFEKGI